MAGSNQAMVDEWRQSKGGAADQGFEDVPRMDMSELMGPSAGLNQLLAELECGGAPSAQTVQCLEDFTADGLLPREALDTWFENLEPEQRVLVQGLVEDILPWHAEEMRADGGLGASPGAQVAFQTPIRGQSFEKNKERLYPLGRFSGDPNVSDEALVSVSYVKDGELVTEEMTRARARLTALEHGSATIRTPSLDVSHRDEVDQLRCGPGIPEGCEYIKHLPDQETASGVERAEGVDPTLSGSVAESNKEWNRRLPEVMAVTGLSEQELRYCVSQGRSSDAYVVLESVLQNLPIPGTGLAKPDMALDVLSWLATVTGMNVDPQQILMDMSRSGERHEPLDGASVERACIQKLQRKLTEQNE